MLQTALAQPQDEGFLYHIYTQTRQAEVSAWGWEAPQQQAFLRPQFAAQQRAYAQQFPTAEHRLIRRGGEPIGRLIVARLPGEIRLNVRKGSPAQRLYERLGFVIVGESELDYAMQWHAQQPASRKETPNG